MTVELIPLDKHWARQIADEGDCSLAMACSNYDAVAEHLGWAVDAYIALYEKSEAVAPWIAYLARTKPAREFVGICAFKGASREGKVEIAYLTFPEYRGKGYGTAMAEQLVDLAFRHPDVAQVIVHTSAEEKDSACIVKRLGFRHDGVVDDPEIGMVCRWSLHRDARPFAWPNLSKALAALTTLA